MQLNLQLQYKPHQYSSSCDMKEEKPEFLFHVLSMLIANSIGKKQKRFYNLFFSQSHLSQLIVKFIKYISW